MKTHLIAALSAALLVLPTPAQEKDPPKLEIGHVIVMHSPVPTTYHRLAAVCGSQEVADVLKHALGTAAAAPQVYANYQSTGDTAADMRREGEERTSIEFSIYLLGELKEPLAPKQAEQAFELVIAEIRSRLQAKLHDEPIARDQRRLAELEDLAKNLEDEHLRLRQRVLAVSDADVANSVAAIAELDRKRLDVELDLRTEEAAQDSLQKMTMETQKRHETLSTQAVELGRQQLKLRSSVTNLRNSLRTSEGHENELKQIDELNSKADDLMQACSSATAEVTRCATQLDAIAEEARKATLSIHRLTARLQVLQSMLEQQRKLAASAQAALFEREAAQVRAEEAKARLTSVRQRAEEIRVRLDAIEPVRLEVWK